MKAMSWIRARPKTLASAAGVTVGVIAITTMAFSYEGFPTTKVDLNDGGVWITKSSSLLVGHFNHESAVLDGGLRTSTENYDILQAGANVVVVDEGNSTLTAIDPARVALGDSAGIPGAAKVALGNQTAAILDQKSGDLWVVPVQGIAGFEIEGAPPTAELGKKADVAVANDGTVFGLSSARNEVVTVDVDPDGRPLESSTAGIGELDTSVQPTITAVGKMPIVLDSAAGVVTTPGGFRTKIPDADGAILQQASTETDAVTLATTSHLVRVPFDGGDPTETSSEGQGSPAAPVSLRGCTYGAWAGSAKFVRECPGDANDVVEDIKDAQESTSLVFRVNRDVIILNDAVGGAAWLANESMQRVDNWMDLTPPEGEAENEEETTEETVETTVPKRDENNTPPTAEDDDFGIRPGGTTILPVLDNDNDADGDVLVASLAQKQPSLGEVQPIYNGGSLQITVPEDAKGSATFTYEVDDGRKGKDTASVTVTVHDMSVNAPPKQKRTTALAVESGGTVSYNILPDWIDPDGDDVYLADVIAAPGDEVEFTKDGQLSYRAVASLQGRKDVQVIVSDSQGEKSPGTIRLDVRPAGTTKPKTNADHVVTRAGETVSVAPLANDTSSGREQLRLSRVVETPGARILADYPNKTFSFRADKPGVYYVQYQVTAGPNGVPGLVRVDVLEKSEADLPPVAVRDVALLPTGGEVLLGVLGNDTEPSGGILVVQSVTVPEHSGVSVSVLNHETLRISDQGALSEQVRIKYRISNGTKSAEGDVIIVPIPAPDKLLPPVANDDQVIVRAGDVVTIPVLDNDTHPNGDALHVLPDLVEPLVAPEDGEAFVSQDTVRFRAGAEAGTVYATYEVVDSTGQKDAGHITIQVLAVDEEKNSAPRPRDLTVRALSGTSTKIAIPLDGLDADGDSVELLENASAPAKGQITEVGANFLTYEAFDDATGVDTFTYRVRDRLGKEGTATIRVGIAPMEAMNQAPYAVKDSVVVRPGRSVAVPVTANDSDPEADTIFLVKDGLEPPPNVPDLKARVSGDRVIVDVPDRELETSLTYTIRDARGAKATAVLQIKVDKDVPLMTPIARDDRVRSEDVIDGMQVDVPVFKNDEDPDGTTESLTLDVETGGVKLKDGTVRVTIGEERQLIRYTITDQDDKIASAFIFVPAKSELRPAPNWTEAVEVMSGETKVLPLSEYVTVAGGGEVIITEANKVSAINADGSSLIKDPKTLVYTSKAGYFGKDALTFEVTDGTATDDPNGRKSLLTIPIKVLPPENQQPKFLNSQIAVAPGEKPSTLDLASLATDPDPEDAEKLTFSVVGQPGKGITAKTDGGMLYAEAGSDVRKGTVSTIRIRVTDGTTEPVEGTVAVTVSASTRNLPTANTDSIDEADQGKSIRVPVLDNDVNPFPETPLKVLSASVESGIGDSKVVGDQVEVTPAADFVGRLVVRYRIQDATKDSDREVDGSIVVTVQGVPDAPGTPSVSSVEDRTVVLSWSPPANNGAEITKYTVRSVQGSPYSKECSATTCTLDGLTNNVNYTFKVTATNRVGEGPESSTSAPARPDARPDTPAPPTLVFGDKSLKVSWVTPTTPGSPVDSYTLQISPAPPSGMTERTVTGNSIVWEGLENGSSYQVRVQAHNLAPEPSSWSVWSPNEIPAGPPGAPGAPTASSAPSVGSQAQMQVTWPDASPNGDAVSAYELRVIRGGSVVRTIPLSGPQTSQNVTVDTSTTEYTFAVRAKNKAGWGEFSAASTPQRAFGSPGAPTITGTKEGDGWVEVSYSVSNTNGANAGELRYEYSVNGSSWSRNWDGKRISAANNSSYVVRVRAYSVVGGQESQPGAPSQGTAGLKPYGPPRQPSASGAVSGYSITWSWSAPAANGRPIATLNWRDSRGNTGSSGPGGGQVAYGYNPAETVTFTVTATDSTGATGPAFTTQARTADPPPPPRAWVTPGAHVPNNSYCGDGTCTKFRLNTNETFPSGTYWVGCSSTQFGDSWSGDNYTFGPNAVFDLYCYHGSRNRGIQVWVTINGTAYERSGW